MEIERKFLVKELPDLSHITPIRYERYFIRAEEGIQERIQKKGDKYELETKKITPGVGNFLMGEKDKTPITKQKFEELKKEKDGIIRDGYLLSENPNISLKIYRGKFEGLVRAEVEFSSVEEAQKYIPEPWMGKEITHTPLGMDSELLRLSESEFAKLVEK